MEKVNVMKKIALFLTVVAVAVVFAACQGAVGPKGDTGDTGEPGTAGTPGTPGTPGDRPLITVEGVGRVLLVNDAKGDVVAITYDMSKEFEGGYGDVAYTPTRTVAADDKTYAISHTGSMLTITLAKTVAVGHTEPAAGGANENVESLDTGEYKTDGGLSEADEFGVKIVAKDTEGVTRERYVYAVRNKAPTAPEDEDIDPVRLGLLSDKRETMLPHKDYGAGAADGAAAEPWNNYSWPVASPGSFISCTLINTCKVTPTQSKGATGVAFSFVDDGALTFTAVTDSANVDVEVADDGAALTLIGRTSTINADGVNRFADQGVTVTVTAKDGGGLTAEKTFRVLVNSPPVAVAGLPTTFTIAKVVPPAVPAVLTVQMSAHFKDPEGATTMRYYIAPPFGEDYNSRVVVALDAGALTLTMGAYKGSREITVRAYEPATVHGGEVDATQPVTEGVGQWHDITFTVVNENGL